MAGRARAQLDMLPPDLAGQVRELQDYEFTSSEARERFDELMDKLKQQLMQSYFNQMAGAMSDVSPEQMQRMKDMFAALNQMLEQREAGQDTQPDVRALHGASSATSSPATRRPSTSCSSRWPSRWRPCRRCSTR